MKKIFVLFTMLIATIATMAQSTVENINTPKAMKPIIMVVPEKAWCINQGFVRKDNPQSPDYEKALLNDDVLNVITKMGGIMQGRGYPLKNLQSALDELKNEEAMDVALTSKADG